MKKLSLLLILGIIISCFAVFAACGNKGEQKTPTKGLSYRLIKNDTEYAVSGIGTATATDIVIAAKHNGKPVTSIHVGAFSDCDSVTSVIIPSSVIRIGDDAFNSCTSLKSVIIPNSVMIIGEFAFCGTALESVTIPDGVIIIGRHVFAQCVYLKEINVDSSNTNYSSLDGVFFNKDKTTLICYPAGKEGAYSIPDGVKHIDWYAFIASENLTEITIPNSMTSIDIWAFAGCDSLTEITLPNSITSIDSWAFAYCRAFVSVIIPSSVERIGDHAFLESPALEIFCEAETQPAGWSSGWNYSNRPVVWGYVAP